ncbi:MAG: tetratricopeptide repeat protein [Desulfovibrio sp.]|nr:tetratricopeptide repeat protein [Desulfovibrio sp.]
MAENDTKKGDGSTGQRRSSMLESLRRSYSQIMRQKQEPAPASAPPAPQPARPARTKGIDHGVEVRYLVPPPKKAQSKIRKDITPEEAAEIDKLAELAGFNAASQASPDPVDDLDDEAPAGPPASPANGVRVLRKIPETAAPAGRDGRGASPRGGAGAHLDDGTLFDDEEEIDGIGRGRDARGTAIPAGRDGRGASHRGTAAAHLDDGTLFDDEEEIDGTGRGRDARGTAIPAGRDARRMPSRMAPASRTKSAFPDEGSLFDDDDDVASPGGGNARETAATPGRDGLRMSPRMAPTSRPKSAFLDEGSLFDDDVEDAGSSHSPMAQAFDDTSAPDGLPGFDDESAEEGDDAPAHRGMPMDGGEPAQKGGRTDEIWRPAPRRPGTPFIPSRKLAKAAEAQSGDKTTRISAEDCGTEAKTAKNLGALKGEIWRARPTQQAGRAGKGATGGGQTSFDHGMGTRLAGSRTDGSSTGQRLSTGAPMPPDRGAATRISAPKTQGAFGHRTAGVTRKDDVLDGDFDRRDTSLFEDGEYVDAPRPQKYDGLLDDGLEPASQPPAARPEPESRPANLGAMTGEVWRKQQEQSGRAGKSGKPGLAAQTGQPPQSLKDGFTRDDDFLDTDWESQDEAATPQQRAGGPLKTGIGAPGKPSSGTRQDKLDDDFFDTDWDGEGELPAPRIPGPHWARAGDDKAELDADLTGNLALFRLPQSWRPSRKKIVDPLATATADEIAARFQLPGALPWQKGMPGGADTRLRGVFSTDDRHRIGFNVKTVKRGEKLFWHLEQRGNTVLRRPLNENMVPTGKAEEVPLTQFMEAFVPEPDVYTQEVLPVLRELAGTNDSADANRTEGNLFTAEFEYARALKVDVENIRANFGIAMTYLDLGDTAKAKDVFNRIISQELGFDEEHKHLLNEFGISLRKSEMFNEAMEYYGKAAALAPDDENLFLNIARLHLEVAMYIERESPISRPLIDRHIECCRQFLERSLSLNPGLLEARRFLKWMMDNNLIAASKLAELVLPPSGDGPMAASQADGASA